MIRIGNDGQTIPEHQLQEIFQPFRKGAGGQFGLGLSIVEQIITFHQGQIYAENTDKGVFFTIQFRIDSQEEQ